MKINVHNLDYLTEEDLRVILQSVLILFTQEDDSETFEDGCNRIFGMYELIRD